MILHPFRVRGNHCKQSPASGNLAGGCRKDPKGPSSETGLRHSKHHGPLLFVCQRAGGVTQYRKQQLTSTFRIVAKIRSTELLSYGTPPKSLSCYLNAKMGCDAGFDTVPPLTKSDTDKRDWNQFIDTVRTRYQDDERVEIKLHYIEFNAGEHPLLPFEGHKFLRFSSKITGAKVDATGVEYYIRAVNRIAQDHFGLVSSTGMSSMIRMATMDGWKCMSPCDRILRFVNTRGHRLYSDIF
jgi:hypothetical protein